MHFMQLYVPFIGCSKFPTGNEGVSEGVNFALHLQLGKYQDRWIHPFTKVFVLIRNDSPQVNSVDKMFLFFLSTVFISNILLLLFHLLNKMIFILEKSKKRFNFDFIFACQFFQRFSFCQRLRHRWGKNKHNCLIN